ncbi:MAG: hypothetical protein IE926_14335 [Micrococcales bacterium]|uniref:hypothetical protein n=1 Tax=Phycicoccus sp. TaxID=1902410 RepID=UPI0019CCA062|nr:hypothetical protein [Phycicoccus sp.]MBD3784101.1 hypothetical protein [Micrococcales bacterium]HMM94192.1 hypothetical protein [Phycicoccus sp.]
MDAAPRTAPDAASGAVPVPGGGLPVPPLRERDFWRAVAASLLATLAPWPR